MDFNLEKFIEDEMLHKGKLNEGLDENLDETLDEDALAEAALNEDDAPAEPKPMSEEELKIESLKIATNIAKLMSDVTTDDIITIADKVSGFIRDHQIGKEESAESSEESSSEENNSGSEDEANIADELELNNEE